jgi:hypothetical protein
MGSFVMLEHEEVGHKRHSCKLTTDEILVRKSVPGFGFGPSWLDWEDLVTGHGWTGGLPWNLYITLVLAN